MLINQRISNLLASLVEKLDLAKVTLKLTQDELVLTKAENLALKEEVNLYKQALLIHQFGQAQRSASLGKHSVFYDTASPSTALPDGAPVEKNSIPNL